MPKVRSSKGGVWLYKFWNLSKLTPFNPTSVILDNLLGLVLETAFILNTSWRNYTERERKKENKKEKERKKDIEKRKRRRERKK